MRRTLGQQEGGRAKADKPLVLSLMQTYLGDCAGDEAAMSAAYDYDINSIIDNSVVERATTRGLGKVN